MKSERDFESVCAAEFLPWERLRNRRILITGATGLIGHSLTGALLCANERRGLGLELLALARDAARARERFAGLAAGGDSLRILEGSVEELPRVEGPVDYILHGASQTASAAFVRQPVEMMRTAALGTLRLLELAREKRSAGFVYLSSMEVYGRAPRGRKLTEAEPCRLQPEDVRDSYPIGKLLCESLCRAYAAEYGVRAMIARLAQTFGPDARPEDARLFAELGRCARERRDIVLRTRGEAERSYLYVADAVTALLTILLAGSPGQIYNAADERAHCSIAELARRVSAAYGIGLRYELEEGAQAYPRPACLDLDTSRLRALGWRPEAVKIRPGESALDACVRMLGGLPAEGGAPTGAAPG